MVKNPIERHDGRVEFTHKILADVIDAVLIVSFIHLGDVRFLGLNVGQNVDVMVMPDVM